MLRNKERYSFVNLVKHALSSKKKRQPAWRRAEPQDYYDAVIIGGGGHGLATAYYLASEFEMRRIAVLEKSWLGSGNIARNTTIVRSNYLFDESAALYDHGLKLWEDLSQQINFNVMFSQRGVFNLAHDDNEMRQIKRRCQANRLNGLDSRWEDAAGVKAICPIINTDHNIRYPILGGSFQPRGGVARHDAVAWGLARAADSYGVDIIEQCEVQDIELANDNEVQAVITNKGRIETPKVGVVVAGNSTELARMANVELPVESHPLQALVSEPLKPIMPTVVMSNAVHVYVSQSDKGELVIGAGIDGHESYAQRGCFNILEDQISALMEMFPLFSRVRMMRHWAGTVDVCPDASPILSKTPVKGLYINAGWGTGGFKATPGSGHLFAYTMAHDEPHPINAPFNLERFTTGALVAEHGAAAVAH